MRDAGAGGLGAVVQTDCSRGHRDNQMAGLCGSSGLISWRWFRTDSWFRIDQVRRWFGLQSDLWYGFQ
ncbi:hypothetical protein ACFX10_032055 [Malus domestica]